MVSLSYFENQILTLATSSKERIKKEDKTANIRSGWFDSKQCVLAILRPFSQVE